MAIQKPRIFIGSSVEGLAAAEHLQLGLDYYAESTLWSQGVFGLSGGTLESLCAALDSYDFAVLVLTPDDLVQKRSSTKNAPRDNVLFELGLFMGRLGRDRTFIVYCRDLAIDLPTDLAGVTAATFAKRSDGNLQAALGPVCTQIKSAVAAAQSKAAKATPAAITKEPAALERTDTLLAELGAMKAELAAQTASVRSMLEQITAPRGTEPRASAETELGQMLMLQGAWQDVESGTMYYLRIVRGELRCVYCYQGNNRATGEYYNWKLANDVFFARYRWFSGSISGFCYVRLVGKDKATGGWWAAADLPPEHIPKLPAAELMVPVTWARLPNMKTFPGWAEDFFREIE